MTGNDALKREGLAVRAAGEGSIQQARDALPNVSHVNLFLTGTDTGVGKTHVAGLLTRACRCAGLDTLALKPVCCGSRDDVDALAAASGFGGDLDEINPVWLAAPVAPLVAAREEGRDVDTLSLTSWLAGHRARRQSLIIEGAGGWLVPLAPGLTMADLAVAFGFPVVVVVANKLGCLNHALLTVESIRARGIACAGLIINSPTRDDSVAFRTNANVLREVCDVPILLEIGHGQARIEIEDLTAALASCG